MKRSAVIIGLVAALLVPASLAVAQYEEAPVAEQTRSGDGNQDECPNCLENGELQRLRLHAAVKIQNAAHLGEGPTGSEEAPFQNEYGPGDCDDECDGPYGPQGAEKGNTHGEQDGTGPNGECDGPYGPLGHVELDLRSTGAQDGTGPIAECDDECDGPYGPQGEDKGNIHGVQDGTGPIGEEPQDGTGYQYGAGSGDNATSSPGGSADQRGPGGEK